MREALDEASREARPLHARRPTTRRACACREIAWMAAVERLDMLLNDAMYGILFRDINMRRTFVDQYFSPLIIARAGIVINTGEDNYLTTADAVRRATRCSPRSSSTRRSPSAPASTKSRWGSATPTRSTRARGQLPARGSPRRSSSGRSSRDARSSGCRPPSTRPATSSTATSHDVDVQPRRRRDRPVDRAARHVQRGDAHALLMDRFSRSRTPATSSRPPGRYETHCKPSPAGRSRPAPSRCSARRSELLRRVADGRDVRGHRAGRVRRRAAPRDGGSGLEGVVERAPGYLNPILELWEPYLSSGRLPVAELVPYGDREGDGMVQICFTLPVPADARAREVGRRLRANLGLRKPQIVHVAARRRRR